MTKQAKNYQRLRHIVEYCEKIKVAAEVFNNSYDTFADDKNYQARDLCIIITRDMLRSMARNQRYAKCRHA